MSINWVTLHPDGRTPVPLPQEKMFFTQDKVSLVLDCTQPNVYPGHGTSAKWAAHGEVTISNQRVMFIAQPSTPQFQSLNVPILKFKNWKLNQPWFGANNIQGTVIPVPGGGMETHGQLTLTFQEGGAIEFTTILRNLMERMAETSETPAHLEPLPQYQASSSHDQDLPPNYNDIM
ncbi:hypothetical protein DM01DRAFT_151005 [Hesseltinella vesiculosa]|uniref:GRAM domain-containing protein n=1 Tax=Hesseltinella vesiculosa TaxID=101127 RepID=A0A1X2GRK4_9FUNG|nr:hypothetical protein DM01DRAFT_151005 [Hesseltinella vesiculosa]